MLAGNRLEEFRLISGVLLLIVVSGLIGCGKQPTKAVTQSDSKTLEEQDSGKIAVPNGTPEELISFINELSQKKPNITTQEEFDAYKADVEHALIVACNRILAQDADDASLGKAVRIRLNMALREALNLEPPKGTENPAAVEALKLINRLREDKRQVVSSLANEYLLAGRIVNLPSLSDQERRTLVDDAIQRLVDSKASVQPLQDVGLLVELLIKENSMEEATLISRRLDQAVVGLGGQARSMATRVRGMVNRANLTGSKLEIEGKKLDGTELDWESYRGKVVLVDFWATWCGPCLQSLPHVQSLYDQYHSKGFEVIGISLDHDRRTLEKFLERRELPWPQLFQDPDPNSGSPMHPMATKYGISAIPAAFLVDQKGNVVSAKALGPDLEKMIQKLLK